MQLYVTYAAQAVKHLVDNLRLVSVATLPSCGSYAAALHLSRRPQAKQSVATAAQRKSRQRSDLDHAENRPSVAMVSLQPGRMGSLTQAPFQNYVSAPLKVAQSIV